MVENFKYLIDSRKLSSKERKQNADEMQKARAERFINRSSHEIKMAKLMQLKFQMEDYLDAPNNDSRFSFIYFLKKYVEIIYKKQKDFAHDLSVEPLLLSQLLNRHREPQEKFMLRLMVHSDRTFKTVCKFDQEIWYKIYYQEKLEQIISTQKNWRNSVEKLVNNSNLTLS